MTTSLMEFPCDFSIKVIGKNTPSFKSDIIAIAKKHYPNLNEQTIRHQISQKETYCSLNITVHALDQASLDALYQELTKHPDINMVL